VSHRPRAGARRPGLAEHLAGEVARPGGLAPGLAALLATVATAGARIAAGLARAALTGQRGETGAVNLHGDRVKRLDLWTNDVLVDALRDTGLVRVVVSEELREPLVLPVRSGTLPYAVCLDPLDGSLNADVDGVLGTIVGIRPANAERSDPTRAVLGSGRTQVAAGYLVYGPATVLVCAAGGRVDGFTLDLEAGEFRLTHPRIRMPRRGRTYALNHAGWHRFAPGVHALVERLRAPARDRRERHALRYSGAFAADVHRILLEGGLYLYPALGPGPGAGGKLRLLYEAAPLALVVEQAGGRASTGDRPLLDVTPAAWHERVPVYVGSAEEMALVERCLAGPPGPRGGRARPPGRGTAAGRRRAG
jgi:fructose-1,6-bisphosphatase I